MKRTKIVATIGPATSSKEKIEQLIKAGVNVGRINFSHGDHKSNGEYIKTIKKIREELDLPIGIMADLQGPRIRTLVDADIKIKKEEIIGIYDVSFEYKKTSFPPGAEKMIGLDWPKVVKNIKIGEDILIEDGLIKLRAIKKEKNYFLAEVIEGGVIKNHKGVNLPDTNLEIGLITDKDDEDLKFALDQDIDFLALSFVSNAKEIKEVRERIKKILNRKDHLPQIVAKIERKEAIRNIAEIIDEADVIMVARGDLGIELPESRVVIYQKEIIARCLKKARPVIVATQMLNSMIEKSRPTRAEVSDVSNAVIDHTDAVMLSGETANGKYPVESVRVMKEIINNTERSPFDILEHGFLGDKSHSVTSAIAHASHELLKDIRAQAIVASSVSGFTARMIARHRPEKTIYVMTNENKTHNQMSLVWGVQSFMLSDCKTLDELIDRSVKTLKDAKISRPKDKLVIIAGRPHITTDHMSMVKVEEVK